MPRISKANKLFKRLTIIVDIQNVSLLPLNNSVLKYGSYCSCSSNGKVAVNMTHIVNTQTFCIFKVNKLLKTLITTANAQKSHFCSYTVMFKKIIPTIGASVMNGTPHIDPLIVKGPFL
jgi:hypothetical protein